MGRILALDIGSKRIGLALSDETKLIAQPLSYTINPNEAVSELAKLIEEFEIEQLLIGLPKSLSGEEGKQVQNVKKIVENITKEFKLPLEYIDERYSTRFAKHFHQDKKIPLDSLAAQKLLEQYLETKN